MEASGFVTCSVPVLCRLFSRLPSISHHTTLRKVKVFLKHETHDIVSSLRLFPSPSFSLEVKFHPLAQRTSPCGVSACLHLWSPSGHALSRCCVSVVFLTHSASRLLLTWFPLPTSPYWSVWQNLVLQKILILIIPAILSLTPRHATTRGRKTNPSSLSVTLLCT